MVQFTYTIRDDLGIHARPAGLIVKAAGKYPCSTIVAKGEKTAEAKNLFALMGLGVKCGDAVTVSFNGDREQEALEEIQRIFEMYL